MPLPADADALDTITADVGARTVSLLARARRCTVEDLAAPSALPGWTRGHVLAHLADNADALATALTRAAAADDAGLMYPSGAARDASIEAGAGRSPQEHLQHLADTADGLAQAWRALLAARLGAVLTGTAGWMRPVRDVPWMRWRELALHAVDLGWPAEFAPSDALVGRLLDESATAVTRRADAPGLQLTDTDAGRTWTTSHAGTAAGVTVSGPASELVLWLTGRSDGAALSASAPLPALPPWL